MKIHVTCVVEARDKSLKLRLGVANQPVVIVPRSAVCYGDYLHGGETDLELDFASWAYAEIMQAIAASKNMRDGSRVLDAQIEIWGER